MERATRGLLNKLLHGPTVHLRNGGARDIEGLEMIRRMFQLEGETGEERAEREETSAASNDSPRPESESKP